MASTCTTHWHSNLCSYSNLQPAQPQPTITWPEVC